MCECTIIIIVKFVGDDTKKGLVKILNIIIDFISHYLSQRKVPLTLTGSSYEGVSVNDVIHNAVKSTNNIV